MIESYEDIIALSIIVEEGDLVEGHVYRKLEHREEDIRKKKAERVRVRVVIRVDKVEIQHLSNRLRVHGQIVEGPEDIIGSYQSISFEPRDLIGICKEWDSFVEEYLEETLRESHVPPIVAIGIEQGSAEIYLIRSRSYERIYSTDWSSGKISNREEQFQIFGEILSRAIEISGKELAVVVYGPGFIKDNFVKFVRERAPDLSLHVVNTNHGDLRGLYELMKGKLEKFLRNYRVSREMMLVDRLLEEIGKEGFYVYGIKDIEESASSGAIDTLLVHQNIFHDREIRRIIKTVREKRGRIVVISGDHEAGNILKSLGGIAAITRFKLQKK